MSTYTFQDFYTIIKKRTKVFSLIFIILIIASVTANNTFLKKKLSQKYTIIFDYDFSYPYINFDIESVLYDEIVRKYIENYSFVKETGGSFSFGDLKTIHETYWELIYKYNLSDTKNTSIDNKYYEISQSFKFDNNNFRFKNRKLRMSWHNIEEAKNYIESLSERAIDEIKEMIIISHEIDNQIIRNKFKNKILTLTTKSILESLKMKHDLKNDLEVEKYVNKNMDYFFNRNLTDREIIMLTLKNVITYETTLSHNPNDKNFVYYYLDKKFNKTNYSELNNIDFLPEISNLAKNIKNYIPKYILLIENVNIYHFYLIQLILSLLIPFIIICTLDYKKLLNNKVQKKN